MPPSSSFLQSLPVFLLLLSSSFCRAPVHALTHPTDIYALKAFKNAISPASITPWSCLASWNFSFDPCSAPHTTHFICGVSCSADSSRVTALTLDPAGYSGTLSPLISKLNQLTHLDLSENSFHGQIPSSISALSNLQTLVLRSNSFSGGIPPSLSTLKSIQTLDISRNALTGSLPTNMGSLTSLQILDLSFNGLVGPLPKLPSSLTQLALKANSLSGPLLEASFHGLNQLEVVELGENKFGGVLNGWFFLLPSIQQVDLANNSLTRVDIPDATGKTSDLVAVDLGFNSLYGPLPVNFVTFPLLSALSLRYNRFSGAIPREYGSKVSLRRLFLDGNFLNGKVPTAFFGGGASVWGSFGANCLESCPSSQQLCSPSQKPVSICKQAYGRKPRPHLLS